MSEQLPLAVNREPTKGDVPMVSCCHCGAKLQVLGRASNEVKCPACTVHLVLLINKRGRCTVEPVSRESVDRMICAWLSDPRDEDKPVARVKLAESTSPSEPAAA
ncbi:MAG: hypothetical protein ACYTHJ_02475 [Planctomycetota bacterium]|jgi:ribosomal protein S27E